MTDWPEHTDVAIVGGGVMGVSIAFHLADAGVSVTLFERDGLGAGTAGTGARFVRSYFPDEPVNSAMATRGVNAYKEFGKRTGGYAGLRRIGHLVVFSEAAVVAHRPEVIRFLP